MAERELKPHGTLAAYRRHLRHGETPCNACREASRNSRRANREAVRPKLTAVPDSPPPVVEVDPLVDALDSLAVIRAALHADDVPISTIANLTKRRDELVDRIVALREASKPVKVSVVDELTSRRKRGAASAR